MLKKLWHDPVFSKVIAGLILAVPGLIVAEVSGLFFKIGNHVSAVKVFFEGPIDTKLPLWQWALISIFFLIGIFSTIFVSYKKFSKSEVIPNYFDQYTEDEFDGIRWRWSYFSGDIINDFSSFCPKCDLEIEATPTPISRTGRHIVYKCPDCKFQSQIFSGSESEHRQSILKQIERALRQRKTQRHP